MTSISTEQTQDHQKIREWVEKRGGVPAVLRTSQNASIGQLRIKFDRSEDHLDEIDWDEFFDAFDKNQLTFLYQEDF